MDDTQIASTLLSYVQDNFKYKQDISNNVEGLDDWQDVGKTIHLGTGDCEDLTLLTASLISKALIKKGHSRDAVSQMVKIGVGYLPYKTQTDTFKLGHTILKFNANPDHPDDTLVLESTAKLSPFFLKNFNN